MQIKNPFIALYDEKGNLTGVATFQLTTQSQKELLDFINNGSELSSLTLLDVNLYGTKYYVPPVADQAYQREGKLYALLLDSNTQRYTPVMIEFKFILRTRANLIGNIYYFYSAEYSDIQVESLKVFY